jgi:general secretion pathway protein C
MIRYESAHPFSTLVNVVFITTAAFLGVSGIYKLAVAPLGDIRPPLIPVEETSSAFSRSARPLSHYREIMERNLFNTRSAIHSSAPKREAVDIASLKSTGLKLKLFGTVTGSKSESYAVIQDLKSRKQSLYSVGDAVRTAVVKRILRNKIILDVNGENQILEIEKRRGATVERHPFNRSVASRSNGPGTRKIVVSRTLVDQAMGNMNHLMRQARVRPHFTDGKPGGLTLTRIQRNSIFRRLGLRNGDIITGVDGKPISSVDDALAFYNSLKSAAEVSLQIKRRGRLSNMEYSIR